jgi:hypothetical protein
MAPTSRLFLQEPENAFGAGKLRFLSNLASLAEPQAFARRIGDGWPRA